MAVVTEAFDIPLDIATKKQRIPQNWRRCKSCNGSKQR